MAVTLNTNADYGFAILALFGVPAEAIAVAKSHKVVGNSTAPGMFELSGPGGKQSVAIKSQSISLAKSGQLGPVSMQEIRLRLIKALEAVTGETLPLTGTKASMPTEIPKPSMNILGMMTKKTGVITPSVQNIPKTTLSQMFDQEEAAKKAFILPGGGAIQPPPSEKPAGGTPINLSEASEVYQPVKGTSKGAVYYVAACMKGLNIAIRSKANTLSIRAEGSHLAAYKDSLQELGFEVKTGYASVHFDATTHDLKMKTVGAVVGRLGMNNLIQAADLSKLMSAA